MKTDQLLAMIVEHEPPLAVILHNIEGPGADKSCIIVLHPPICTVEPLPLECAIAQLRSSAAQAGTLVGVQGCGRGTRSRCSASWRRAPTSTSWRRSMTSTRQCSGMSELPRSCSLSLLPSNLLSAQVEMDKHLASVLRCLQCDSGEVQLAAARCQQLRAVHA